MNYTGDLERDSYSILKDMGFVVWDFYLILIIK